MIRFLLSALFLIILAFLATPSQARDTEYKLKIEEVLQRDDYSAKIGNEIRFYFSGQKPPAVAASLGEFVTNRKTNSVGKPDEDACRWAMLSALVSLRDLAKEIGGDAVIDVVSYYKKKTFASGSEYECHAGNIVAGVALKGTIVKLKK
jgi:uncharacterized protein YbjQ (UPF0145 family)